MGAMQKANVTVLIVVVVVVAALIAAEWYFFDYRPSTIEAQMDGTAPPPEVSELSGDTSEIIECEDPEVGTFYTDADSCEEAEPPKSNYAPPPDNP